MMPHEQKFRVNPRSHPRKSVSIIGIVCIAFLLASAVYAAEKNWDAGGDGSDWSDGDNWHPAGIPTLADDIVIDSEDAEVTCSQTFKAKSITVGGRETSKLTSENFVYGTVEPDATSDVAMLCRPGGTIKLKKAGVLTLKGQYMDSEETLAAEPSFIFWVE